MRERDRARARNAMIYLAAVAAALLATFARYPGTVEWDTVTAWIYVAFFLALLAAAVRGFAPWQP